MKLVRTEDLSIIESIFLHPEIKPEVGDAKFIIHDSVYWLLSYQDENIAGCIVFFPIYSLAWNPHIAILPKYRGCGSDVMREGCAWMFENTACLKLLAFPFKPIMQRVYQKAGFQIEGFSRGLLYRDGNLLDCQIVGLNK